MVQRTLINGTGYTIIGGRTLIDGTGYAIKKGRTLIGGLTLGLAEMVMNTSLSFLVRGALFVKDRMCHIP